MNSNLTNKDLFKIILRVHICKTTCLIKICHKKEGIMKFYKEIYIKITYLNRFKINKKD